jgi:hypothetical protein
MLSTKNFENLRGMSWSTLLKIDNRLIYLSRHGIHPNLKKSTQKTIACLEVRTGRERIARHYT